MNNNTILIVEDEGVASELIRRMLERNGYRIAGICREGETGIKQAKKAYPSLVLMDIMLAGKISGIEAADYIYKNLGIPVIYLTAHSDAATLRAALQTNPFGYLVKPIDEAKLIAAIAVALHKRQLEKRLKRLKDLLITLRKVESTIARESTDTGVVNEVVQRLVAKDSYKCAWISLLNNQKNVTYTTVNGFGDDFTPIQEKLDRGELTYCLSTALKTGDTTALNTSNENCSKCPLKDKYCKNGVLIGRLEYQNQLYGFLFTGLHEDSELTPEEEKLFAELASSISIALYRIVLEQAQERNTRALKALSDVNEAISKVNDEIQLIKKVCRIIVQSGYRFAWVGRIFNDEEGHMVKPLAWYGKGKEYINHLNLDIGDRTQKKGPAGRAFRTGKTQIVQSIRTDKSFARWRKAALEAGFRSGIAIPLRQGQINLGILIVYSGKEGEFDRDETRLLKQLASNLSYGIVNLRTRLEAAKVARALAESEARLKQATEVTHIGVWDWNIKNNYITYNNEWVAMLGFTLKDVPHNTNFWRSRLHPEDAERVLEKLDRHLKGITPVYRQEYRLRNRKGEWIWIRDHGRVIERTRGGKPLRAIGIHLDITEEKENELKLRKLSTAVEHSPAGVVITDADGNIEYVNPAFTQVTGYRLEEVYGKTLGILKSGLHDRKFYKNLWDTITTGKTWRGEICNLTKSGELIWESELITPIVNKDNQITAFLNVRLDITQRKLSESLLKESAKRLQEAQAIALLGNWTWDIQNDKLTWSEQVYRIFGKNPRHFTPTLDKFLKLVVEKDRPLVRKAIEQSLQQYKPHSVEYQAIKGNGKLIYLSAKFRVEQDNNGQPLKMFGTLQDITTRKKLELQLKEKLEFENLIARISNTFINLPANKIKDGIQRAIARLGKYAQADRCYIFEFKDNGRIIDNTFEWVAPGVEPAIDMNRNLQASDFTWLLEQLQLMKPVQIRSVADMPDELSGFRDFLMNQDIRSIIEIPLIFNKQLIGFLGFDAVQEEKTWPRHIARLMIMAGQSIVNAMMRAKAELSLQESNQKLKELSRRLESIREEEKKAIALTIHDELGQLLTAVKLDLFWLQNQLEKNNISETLRHKLNEALEITNQSLLSVRRISHELRPTILDNFGLESSLEWLINNYRSRTNIEIIFNSNIKNQDINPEAANTIYRIIQEAMNNIVKHAEATHAEINLYESGKNLKLEINDNGKGITTEQIERTAGLGIFGMQERLRAWDGSFQINGVNNKGTYIDITIPLNNIKG